MRKTIAAVFELNKGPYPMLSGSELNSITSTGGFDCNLETRIEDIQKAITKAVERGKTKSFKRSVSLKPRILLTGCPTTNLKVLELIENSGAIVVASENCGGLKTVGELVTEDGDLLRNLSDRYLRIACSCMTPNHRRLELIQKLISDFSIDGVVDLTWEGCHTYNIEAYLVGEAVESQRTPYLQITTDYSENDMGQLQTRIEAFLELLI
jgi:benzoyl-CoA reductase/2-hydroxyglutaryl-CoA dehydratase subunit BcrC/BadD/HgdB